MAAPIFVADEIVAAAKINLLPKGVLGYAERTSDQTGISALTDLTGLSVTVDVAANRTVRVTGKIRLIQRTGAGAAIAEVRESSTSFGRIGTHTLQTNEFDLFYGAVIISAPSAGSHTYKLSLSTSAATVDALGAAGIPNFILVEDIGGV